MSRLNLICSGMMLFHEAGDRLQLFMPHIEGHVRKFGAFGADDLPVKDDLKCLDQREYELTGVGSRDARLADLLDSTGYVLLDGDKVKFHEREARKVSAVFSVPKPDIMRLYRASEPLQGFDLLGNCNHAVVGVPQIVHDIIVISYKNPPADRTVTLAPWHGDPLATAQLRAFDTANWILYADEEQPFNIQDPLKLSDHELERALKQQRHATTLNDFLELRPVSGATAGATTLKLSGIGRRDTPCVPAIGMRDRHLFLYHELPQHKDSEVKTPVCGEAGCSGVCLATQ